MDYNYLLEYRFYEILSLIEGNHQIKKSVEEINNSSYPYESNILEEIILQLNQDELLKIDKEVQKTDLSARNWEAKPYNLNLKDRKVNIYKEFILVKEKIFNEIKSKLSLFTSQKTFYYSYNNGDILTIPEQNIILFGHINNDSHLFNIKYILEYTNQNFLEEGLLFIEKNGIENYKKENTIFNKENNRDLISPIFIERCKYTIGIFYKYSPGISYDKIKEDYSKYLNNENLTKILKLYDYYEEFRQKIKDKNNDEKSYYLINKEIMDRVKEDYNYNIIIQTLSKGQFKPTKKNNQKRILYILKNLPEEIYEDFIKDQNPIEKRLIDYSSPNKILISNPNALKDSIQIFNNFEIIESSLAKEIFGGINVLLKDNEKSNYENYVECSLNDGKIIIHYPKNKFNNGKFIYAVGSLDDDNTFINEYLFIYSKQKEHFNSIKYKLNNKYLQSIENSFFNNSCPITNFVFEEIGTIIKLDSINYAKKENIQNINIKAQIPLKINFNKVNRINFNQAYILQKVLLNKLKQIYSINEAISYLNNNQQLNDINYNNFEENYPNISIFLNQNQLNYINNIKQIENTIRTKVNENELTLVLKNFNNQNNLKYIDDFEIIDKDFAFYLFKLFNNNIMIYKVDYTKIENKLFLVININQDYIYEIVNLNNNDSITVEYLIKIEINKMTNDINALNDIIINLLIDNGIKKLINHGNPINIGQNLIINLFTLNINS